MIAMTALFKASAALCSASMLLVVMECFSLWFLRAFGIHDALNAICTVLVGLALMYGMTQGVSVPFPNAYP